MSWLSLNLTYIRAVNADDTATLAKLFDQISEKEHYFTSRLYIWNHIRGKEFCRNVAEWVIDWYRRSAESINAEDSVRIMGTVIRTLHWILTTESNDRIRRSLVWKITKYAPILTVDTLPHISEERLRNILDSDKWIVCDEGIRPIVQYAASLKVQLANEKATAETLSTLLSN